ncbi:MupA/Atu3671 family FMN-dependent luciferase-like monooxygenase [Streptomyces sp. HK10]|uniref:MupA/Atu3671 family FMN-dependent luciferase-like monooxygenase n=1 Tax=Streptomyces sp. HK10 TaxID=3373255 RepID=UPI003747EA22
MTPPTPSGADRPRLSADRQQLLELLRRRGQVPRTATAARETVAAAPDADAPAGGRPPKISLFFFSADLDDRPDEKYELVTECAQLADRLGLHAVWVPERHFDGFGAPYPAPAVLLAALAARTERLRLRAGSVVLPLHDPLLVAEQWGVLDAISGGRAGISLASGWHPDDFVLAPDAYDRRRELLAEGVEELRRLWADEAVERTAPQGRSIAVRSYPVPRTTPPMWLTSTGNPETWRTAGRLGMNVLTALLQQTVEEVAERAALYRRELPVDGLATEITVMLHTHLGPDDAAVRRRVREPLLTYLSAHLDLFAKQAVGADLGVRPEDVSEEDRQLLLEHGLQRYYSSAGLFGTVESCRPMVEKLRRAGATELACLVDFGLPREQVLQCVHHLAELQQALADDAAAVQASDAAAVR